MHDSNLKAAQALGIRTIREWLPRLPLQSPSAFAADLCATGVFPRSSLPALRSLEKETGMQLVTDAEAREEEERVARKEASEKGQGKAKL
jgi:hypothetical protein